MIIESLDFFKKKLQAILIGYHKLSEKQIHDFHQDFIEKLDDADRKTKETMELLSEYMPKNENLKEFVENYEIKKIRYEVDPDDLIEKYLIDNFQDSHYKTNGYCLKENILRKAVQYKHDETKLGFIENIDENPRFVYVDFGDNEGPIKIDIEELIF
jgi:hypothetical protein